MQIIKLRQGISKAYLKGFMTWISKTVYFELRYENSKYNELSATQATYNFRTTAVSGSNALDR